jgi:hypothetical protein
METNFSQWTGLSLLLGVCAACGSESEPPLGAIGDARYVIATGVSDDENSNTYVVVLDSLEVEELDLSRGLELGGWSDLAVAGEWVFVSSGEGPVIQRFTVGVGLELVPAGTIDFGFYTDDANFYNHTIVSPTKAYMLGEGEFVIWDPTALEITGTLPSPDVVKVRDGIEPYLALDRGAVVRDGRLYATLTWTDTQELDMLPDSRILVLDVEADAVVDVLDVPCPDVAIADADEDGSLYFSNWVYSPGATLLMGDSPACAVRIPAGSEALDAWSFPYAEATGHEGAVMSYLGEGQWLYSSFLGEADAYDPETDDWFDWLFGDTWELRVVDPNDLSTGNVSGIGRNGGGYYSSRFDDTTHLLMPENSYTATTVFAVDAEGVVTRKLHTQGWATRLFKLR